jgi:hypothetical protein
MLAMAKRKKPPEMPPDRIVVSISDPELGYMREREASAKDILWQLLSRRQIDQPMFNAGRHWQQCRYLAEGIGTIMGLDTTREPVDTCTNATRALITDRQQRAREWLIEAELALGPFGARLVESVLWKSIDNKIHPITSAAAERGMVSQRGVEYIGRRFRECLETLVDLGDA